MSSTYSQSGRNTPVEQRIYTLSSVNSEETISTTAVVPTLNPTIPRIRILLAPYMSPYVVPVHRVRTWENLQQTLAGLFGTGVFNGRPVRITDTRGNTILPGAWRGLVRPKMTIIVDTCAYIPESPVTMFGPLGAEITALSWDNPHIPRSASQRRCEYDDDHHENSGHIKSATISILPRHEGKDAAYEGAHIMSPLGQVGDLASTAPVPNSWKARPLPQQQPRQSGMPAGYFDKRATSISMFVERRAAGDKIDRNITVKPLVIEKKPSKVELRSTKEVRRQASTKAAATRQEHEHEERSAACRAGVNHEGMGRYREEDDRLENRYGKPEKKAKKWGWSKVARALMFILTGGQAQHQDANPRKSWEEFKSNEYGQNGRWHTVSPRASQPPPPTMRHVASTQQLQKRRGITSPAPVTSGSVNSKYVRRSSSLGAIPALKSPAQPPSLAQPPKRQPNKLRRSASERKASKIQKSLPRSASLNRHHQCVISPPIPRRPSGDLGLCPQYILADKLDIDELREMAQDQLDGSTLGGRSRRGTGSSGRTAVDSVIEVPQRAASRLSAFPPKSPPRSPVKRPEIHPLPEADRRPPTTTPLIARKAGLSHTIRRISSIGEQLSS